ARPSGLYSRRTSACDCVVISTILDRERILALALHHTHLVPNDEWFVMQTKPCREDIASRHLDQKGIENLVPWIIRPKVPGRIPLFPGYLFAHLCLERQYAAAKWTPGVKGVVAFGGVPSPVPEAVIAFLRRRSGSDGVVRTAFQLGEHVTMCRGPLRGLSGII